MALENESGVASGDIAYRSTNAAPQHPQTAPFEPSRSRPRTPSPLLDHCLAELDELKDGLAGGALSDEGGEGEVRDAGGLEVLCHDLRVREVGYLQLEVVLSERSVRVERRVRGEVNFLSRRCCCCCCVQFPHSPHLLNLSLLLLVLLLRVARKRHLCGQ